MICGLTADERDVLLQGLDEVAETMPPRVVWNRIREQAEAEGLIRSTVAQRPSAWFGGFAVAAAVVLAVLIVPKTTTITDLGPTATEPPVTAQNDQLQVTAL